MKVFLIIIALLLLIWMITAPLIMFAIEKFGGFVFSDKAILIISASWIASFGLLVFLSKKIDSEPEDKKKVRLEKLRLNGSNDLGRFLSHNWSRKTIEIEEQFLVHYLNKDLEVIGAHPRLSKKGKKTSTWIDQKIIISEALKYNPDKIILFQSHSSGNLEPSFEDRELNNKLKLIGDLLDINIQHFIISKKGYYWFKYDRIYLTNLNN